MSRSLFYKEPPPTLWSSVLFWANRINWQSVLSISVMTFGTYYLVRRITNIASPPMKSQQLSQDIVKRISNRGNLKFNDVEMCLLHNVIVPESITVGFDEIGGLSDVKEQLKNMIILPFLRPDLFNNNLLSFPRGIMLYGPPGTGKTMLAKAIAKQSQAVFIRFNEADMLQQYLGQSEKMIEGLFTLAAKLQPAIIFVDEADSVFGARGKHDQHIDRLKCALLSQIDGVSSNKQNKILIMCATNRKDILDPAFLRRMDRDFFIGLPNVNERISILKIFLTNDKIQRPFDFDELAHATEGYSGSGLEMLCRAAAQAVLLESTSGLWHNEGTIHKAQVDVRKIRLSDCLSAMKSVKAPKVPQADKNDENKLLQAALEEFLKNASQPAK